MTMWIAYLILIHLLALPFIFDLFIMALKIIKRFRMFAIVGLACSLASCSISVNRAANYPRDAQSQTDKIAIGEISIRDGISASDLAAYDRVRMILNERTDKEAELFADPHYEVRR
jgi:hypothetical protein